MRRKRNTYSIHEWTNDRGELGSSYYSDINGQPILAACIPEINRKKVTWNPDPYATWGRGDSILEAFYRGKIEIE